MRATRVSVLHFLEAKISQGAIDGGKPLLPRPPAGSSARDPRGSMNLVGAGHVPDDMRAFVLLAAGILLVATAVVRLEHETRTLAWCHGPREGE